MGAVAATLAAWNLVGYPLYLLWRSRRAVPPTWRRGDAGPISVLVAAHDEEDVIGDRVRNLREQEDVGETLQILVVADGCTDGTAEAARAAGAEVIERPRSGKVAALHAAVARARGDVLVLTDANTRFAPGAVRALVAPLADPRVGIAAGDLRYEGADASASSSGENLYWRYETAIKGAAARCGLLLMGAGGIYAVRRADWPPDLAPDLADDSYVPLSLHRSGRWNAWVPEAVGYERAGARMEEEWRRRVRMVAQDVRVAAALSFGFPNRRTAFALVSQKVLRWLLFPLGLAAAAALPVRWTLPAAAGLAAGGALRVPGLAQAAYLVGATAAACAGLALGISGRSPATWRRAETTRAGDRT